MRNKYRNVLLRLACLAAVHSAAISCFGGTVQVEELSTTTLRAKISYAYQPQSPHFIGFTCAPGSRPLLAVSSALTGTTYPVDSLAAGYQGSGYAYWALLSRQEAYDSVLKVTITTASPVFNPARQGSIRLRNSILNIPLRQVGAKKMQTSAPPLPPYRTGLQLEVNHDGIYELTGAQLKSAGVIIDAIAARSFKLYLKDREVPIYLTNAHRTHMRPDDKLLFYGRHLRGEQSQYTQFSFSNIYWLTWGGKPGVRIAEHSGGQRIDPTRYLSIHQDTIQLEAQHFLDTIHIEIDNDIRWLGDINNPVDISQSPETGIAIDNWFWGVMGFDEITSFDVSIPSPAPKGEVIVSLGLMGLTSEAKSEQDHLYYLTINANSPNGDSTAIIWDGQTEHVHTTDPFSVSELEHGINKFIFRTLSEKQRSFADRAALNWIEVIYPRTFQALNNRLLFKNHPDDVDAVKQFTLRGFTTDNLDLWDISNGRVLKDFTLSRELIEDTYYYKLVFQDSLLHETSFLASAIDNRRTPKILEIETIEEQWDFPSGVDYLIISTQSMRQPMQPLLDHYTSRGLNIAFVDITDVYNRFAYGIRDPEALRSLIKHAIGTGGRDRLTYVLLGGDTTHDLDKKRRNRNLVPTHITRVPGWGPCSDDGYFATVLGTDNFADLLVGRFPAENPDHMRIMVQKTLAYSTGRLTGAWRDNCVLAGGFEWDFSEFNDEVMTNIIGSRMHIDRMDAAPNSAYYYSSYTASSHMADLVNAGTYFINFNGHGGGNVWSDNDFFKIEDISKLYNDRWDRGGRLPYIFSFTCLTGFFESSFYQSLGEELLRKSMGGAIGFYGASAYTSKPGNITMNTLLLRDAVREKFGSIGELIRQCETKMLVLNARKNLHLTRQYNLLGDPALPWQLPPDSMSVDVAAQVHGSTDTLFLAGTTSPISSGSLRLRISGNGATLSDRTISLATPEFSMRLPLKDSSAIAYGSVRAIAWNDSQIVRGWQEFAANDFSLYDVRLSGDTRSSGDSVTLACKAVVPQGTSVAVQALYTVEVPWEYASSNLQTANQVPMSKDSVGVWHSDVPFIIPNSTRKGAALLVQFRALLSGAENRSVLSKIYTFELVGLPDWTFSRQGPQLAWNGDSLRLHSEIINAGNEVAPSISVYGALAASPDSMPLTAYPLNMLNPGRAHAVAPALPDTSGVLPISLSVNRNKAIKELDYDNNISTTLLRISYMDVSTVADTLYSLNAGLGITAVANDTLRNRLFLIQQNLADSQPLASPSSWLPLRNDSIRQFNLGARPALGAADSLTWIFAIDTSAAGNLAKSSFDPASAKVGVVGYDTLYSTWRYIPSIYDPSSATITMPMAGSGPYAVALIEDISAPDISISVAGRSLSFLDYAAKNKPFNVFLTDQSGIDPASLSLRLNGKPLNDALISGLPLSGDLSHVRLTTYPSKERSVDSLAIRACDFAGNCTTSVFAYMPGEDLEIKFVACHPNPVPYNTATSRSKNARIAFLLTDVARNVTVVIYTMSGKKVRTWSLNDIIGYQEIAWDVKTQHGYRIANGTYYLKLTAENDEKKVSKLMKVAKMEGY
ncbi:MAG: hypothetical protein GF398_05375 [Chitinivibrionales bacterium]|nr:hypothetical protein [Chitinivibrionales bacterium]